MEWRPVLLHTPPSSLRWGRGGQTYCSDQAAAALGHQPQGTGSLECCRGLLFPVAGISACSVIRALSRRVALSATPVACPPSLTLVLAAPGQSPWLPQGLDCHLPLPGLASPLCEVSEWVKGGLGVQGWYVCVCWRGGSGDFPCLLSRLLACAFTPHSCLFPPQAQLIIIQQEHRA